MKIRIKNLESYTPALQARIKLLKPLFFILIALFLPSPAYAEVNIGEKFGFGNIASLGQAVSKLVMPIFSIAAAMVIIYFLWGAFNYLKSGGNKEEVAGARQMITHAIIGFIILIFAFLVLQFLLSKLININNILIGT